MKAFVPGIYPRSEQLVQATRDLDRGRTSQEAVDEQVVRDLAELVSVQQQAGLDLLTDGMLRWQDPFRPLLEASEGLETGALTRFLDTNTFYRAPHATTATPKLDGLLDERYVAPFPGPALSTVIWPPCRSTIRLTIDRPRPVELSPAVGLADKRWKRPNSREISSGESPAP